MASSRSNSRTRRMPRDIPRYPAPVIFSCGCPGTLTQFGGTPPEPDQPPASVGKMCTTHYAESIYGPDGRPPGATEGTAP